MRQSKVRVVVGQLARAAAPPFSGGSAGGTGWNGEGGVVGGTDGGRGWLTGESAGSTGCTGVGDGVGEDV
jgi:hypothetical protein